MYLGNLLEILNLYLPFKRCIVRVSGIILGVSLVGGFNPVEKYARQIGSSPQVVVNMKNVSNQPKGTLH